MHDGWLHFPVKDTFTDLYLYQLFLVVRKQLVQQGNGSVFTNLKTDILKDHKVVVPNASTLLKFDELMTDFNKKLHEISESTATLERTRDTLLPKLISSELTLPPDNNHKTTATTEKKTYDDADYPIMKQLKNWFQQKSADELSEIILNYIGESADEQSRWQLTMLNDQGGLNAAAIKKMITKALPKKQAWGYSEASAYFHHSDNMFVDIFTAIDNLAVDKQWQLVLHALVRLNTVLEQIDDSGGYRFDIEGELNHRLCSLFNQQAWSVDEKAQWIFEHYKEYKYDVFPSVPDDFTLTDKENDIFISLCATEAEKRSQQGVDLSVWKEKWALQHLIKPLIKQAQQQGDWQAQCRLMKMTAVDPRDHLEISQLCLGENEPL